MKKIYFSLPESFCGEGHEPLDLLILGHAYSYLEYFPDATLSVKRVSELFNLNPEFVRERFQYLEGLGFVGLNKRCSIVDIQLLHEVATM